MRILMQLKPRYKEWLFLIILMLIYGIAAFWQLGDHSAPTTYSLLDDATPSVTFQVSKAPTAVALYAPVNDSSKYIGISIQGSNNGVNWSPIFDTDDNTDDYTAAMIWYNYTLKTTPNMRYIKIQKHTNANRLVLSEIAFLDENEKTIQTKALSEKGEALLDEPDTIQLTSNRMNSAYFDESYFPSSALEMQDGLAVAEMDHPPIGRLIIGLGMSLWGRNPFGFRFMQALAGIIMLPLLYYFAKALFHSYHFAALCSCLLALDFLHYTQTRIGTLDAFLVLFILGMYAFMFFYHQSQSKYWRYINLFLSGLCTGCAIGTKWSGMYAACGLALLYFYWLVLNIKRKKYTIKNGVLECLWCVFCFVILPFSVYCLSYIQYAATVGDSNIIHATIIHAQQMLSYHTGSSTHFNHPYSSKWWTWFFALKPVFYYYEAPPANVYLYATGNPITWGFGVVGILFALARGIAKDDDTGIVIAIGYLCQLIPWFFISRDTFLYHYFPMIPFLMLGIGYLFKYTCNHSFAQKWKKRFIVVYGLMVVASFIVAFPFIFGSAMPWDTIVIIRQALQISAGVLGGLYILLIAWDHSEKQPSKKEDHEFD